MKTIGIELKRYPYEEPHILNLVFTASNGTFEGDLEYYCNAEDLVEIGEALRSFPRKMPDEYSYELGSLRAEDRCAYYFALRAYTTDKSGHCALQVVIDNRRDRPNEGACRFSIKAEPSSVNRLGHLLLTFSKLEHHALTWSASGERDALIEHE
jgi:hypothetical protein